MQTILHTIHIFYLPVNFSFKFDVEIAESESDKQNIYSKIRFPKCGSWTNYNES